jgi:hypothetical protein
MSTVKVGGDQIGRRDPKFVASVTIRLDVCQALSWGWMVHKVWKVLHVLLVGLRHALVLMRKLRLSLFFLLHIDSIIGIALLSLGAGQELECQVNLVVGLQVNPRVVLQLLQDVDVQQFLRVLRHERLSVDQGLNLGMVVSSCLADNRLLSLLCGCEARTQQAWGRGGLTKSAVALFDRDYSCLLITLLAIALDLGLANHSSSLEDVMPCSFFFLLFFSSQFFVGPE